jgi:hypothetical protein
VYFRLCGKFATQRRRITGNGSVGLAAATILYGASVEWRQFLFRRCSAGSGVSVALRDHRGQTGRWLKPCCYALSVAAINPTDYQRA